MDVADVAPRTGELRIASTYGLQVISISVGGSSAVLKIGKRTFVFARSIMDFFQ